VKYVGLTLAVVFTLFPVLEAGNVPGQEDYRSCRRKRRKKKRGRRGDNPGTLPLQGR